MDNKKIIDLLERQINGTFMKAKLLDMPEIKINLIEPDENGFLGDNIANTHTKINEIKITYHIPDTEMQRNYTLINITDPVIFTFPKGKNEYCYIHLARHEAVHIVTYIATQETKNNHNRKYYDIGNSLFDNFEYEDKNLCENCPEKRFGEKS